MYTTGEMAKRCGVTVRTVQYYDTRGILSPSELSEGGRRLYSEEDLARMRIICFLRELNIPINSIGELLMEEHPENVISVILDEQQKTLRAEMDERQQQLDKLDDLRRTLKWVERFSVGSFGDIAHIMESKKKLRRLRGIILAVGILMDLIQIGTLLLWIFQGIWWPFAVGLGVVVALGVWVSRFYCSQTAYICPSCHAIFHPDMKKALWAWHTPHTRRLTCTACGHHGYCVETYREEMKNE